MARRRAHAGLVVVVTNVTNVAQSQTNPEQLVEPPLSSPPETQSKVHLASIRVQQDSPSELPLPI